MHTYIWHEIDLRFYDTYTMVSSTDTIGVPREEATFLTEEQWTIFDTLAIRRFFGLPTDEMIRHYEDFDFSIRYGNEDNYGSLITEYLYDDYYYSMMEVITPKCFDVMNGTFGESPIVISKEGEFATLAMQADGPSTDLRQFDTYRLIESTEDRIEFQLIRYHALEEDVFGDHQKPEDELKPALYEIYPYIMVKTENGWRFDEYLFPHNY